jgi:tRNA-dihydrouridine synthase B
MSIISGRREVGYFWQATPAKNTPPCTPSFHIRDLPIYGDLILAPMDGYSDQPFRSLCRGLGSAISYTEFINAIDVLNGHPYLHEKLAFQPEERPLAYQIFDNDPDRLLAAAQRLQAERPDFIDVNLGCSARTVSGRGAGAGLLREPEKIAAIFKTLTRTLPTPVTAKIRLGWDETSRNYRQVARLLEENGAAAIAVHGRTRTQGLHGQADWDAIAEIRQAISIPVIANGDVITIEDIDRIKGHTGCPAVMIGRGAIGNPWIFSRLDRDQVPPETVNQMIRAHLEAMLEFYGPQHGLIWFRKHLIRYLRPYPLSADLRHQLVTTEKVDEFLILINLVFSLSIVQRAAVLSPNSASMK